MRPAPAVVALIVSVLAVSAACSSSGTPVAASRPAGGSSTSIAAAPTTGPTPVVATTASTPLVLLARLHAGGVACNYLPTAFQYAPGFSQSQCIRGSASSTKATSLDFVTLRVYDSATTKTLDLAALHLHGVTALVGPNWAALPDRDFPLSVLRGALGGNLSR